jgi:uncharacterized protein (DUF1015 family)
MIIKPFRALYPNTKGTPLPAAFFERARDHFPQHRQDGWYETAGAPAFYLYQIETDKRRYTGLAALNPLEEFLEGRIKAHEDTLYEKERQQIALFHEWEAILKPVLLAYPAVETIENRLNAHTQTQNPWIELDFETERHRIWQITSAEDIRAYQQLFENCVPRAYIADGHHRVTGLARMFSEQREQPSTLDCSHLYCACFADTQLEIHDYNRVVCSERLRDESTFLSVLNHVFEIKKNAAPQKPAQKGEFALYFHGIWYTLNLKAEALKKIGATDTDSDAELLNTLVLRDLFGIEDVRGNRNVRYIEGIKGCEGVKALVDQNVPSAGFMLYPLRFEALKDLIDAGKHLPPKSTWFEPRLKSGLLVKRLLADWMNV